MRLRHPLDKAPYASSPPFTYLLNLTSFVAMSLIIMYGRATVSRLLKIIGLFSEDRSLL